MLKFILLAIIISFSVACGSSSAPDTSTKKVRAHRIFPDPWDQASVFILDVDTMYRAGDTLWFHTMQYIIVK